MLNGGFSQDLIPIEKLQATKNLLVEGELTPLRDEPLICYPVKFVNTEIIHTSNINSLRWN